MVRLYSKSLPAAHRGKTSRRTTMTYGVGAGEVVVVVVPVAGGIGCIVAVLVAGGIVWVVVAPAGDGFTIVVLFVTAGDGDAAVVVVGWTSVRCSHDTRSAALARMQMVFFIGLIWLALVGLTSNRTNGAIRTCLSESSRACSAEFLMRLDC